MGAPTEHEIERGVRYGLLMVFVTGIRRGDPGAVVNAVAGVVGTYVPDFVEWTFDVELRSWHRAYIETAMITHAIGMLGPYEDVWWWDHLTHTHSATIIGGAAYVVSRRQGRDPRPRVIAAVVCLGLLWELLEYAIQAVARWLGVDAILVPYGAKDTALDLVFDLVGAMLVLAVGDRVLDDLATEA